VFPDGAREEWRVATERGFYDHHEVETRWRARWDRDRLYDIDSASPLPKPKFYNLVEFPYPSSEGLHVGHAYTYCGADTLGRYLRMHGRAVFQPIGFDSFGIHTENYALRVGEHPATLTARTIANYREQLKKLGGAWDWAHEIVTSDPTYYRWTQWVFLELQRAGLAFRQEAPVVWCPSCQTVLAFEQLEGDRCERCGSPVTERVMKQWFLRITAYADVLVDELDHLDWPSVAKRLQREWIGRSRGSEIDFAVEGGQVLHAFTTRADTLYGASFVAIAPGHPLAEELSGASEDTGGFTGRHAVHPGTGELLPVYAAPYVVAEYGTGAVMGVPAHDERDHAFAIAHGLPVVPVVVPEGGEPTDLPWTGEGTLIDSGPFTGLPSGEARESIADWLEQRGLGRRATRYRLHDWLISRQRYWGPPIPMVHCPSCGEVPVPEDQLPVLLPDTPNFRPTGTGVSPIAAVEAFVNTECPACGGPARRETDVSDTFLDSAWYFLRYPSADIHDAPWDPGRTARMLPVDQYAGGPEHVMRHHLYARFVTRALHDLGHLPFAEPFPRLRLHGLLISEGAKMSKSRGNVVNPDDYIEKVGADSLRMYLLFCGPWEEGGDFTDHGLNGIVRFTRRIWRLLTEPHERGPGGVDLRPVDRAIARVTGDIERLKFNTAISTLMELVRWAAEVKARMAEAEWRRTSRTIILLLAPFAPYLTEELWARIGEDYSVHRQAWPTYDPRAIRSAEVTLVIQVDGRVRDRRVVPAGLSAQDALRVALESANVRRHLRDDGPRDVVHVPDRLVNLLS
jgi:leucyl-tRNA synthetase